MTRALREVEGLGLDVHRSGTQASRLLAGLVSRHPIASLSQPSSAREDRGIMTFVKHTRRLGLGKVKLPAVQYGRPQAHVAV